MILEARVEILLATAAIGVDGVDGVDGVAATARPKGQGCRIPALVHIGGGGLHVAGPGRRNAVASTVGGRAEATGAMKQTR